MNDKFIYKDENEIVISNNQCELCFHYNDGKRSNICPIELLNQIINNDILCPKLLDKQQLNIGLFTREEIIEHYINIFGEDPTQKVINYDDMECIDILVNSIKKTIKNCNNVAIFLLSN